MTAKLSGDAPHSPAAFINAIAEEGTKAEAVEWLQKTWNELCQAESRVRHLEAVNSNLSDANMALADQVESLQRSAPPPPSSEPINDALATGLIEHLRKARAFADGLADQLEQAEYCATASPPPSSDAQSETAQPPASEAWQPDDEALNAVEKRCYTMPEVQALYDLRAAYDRLAALRSDGGCTVPEGWKLVPMEPTREMLAAACRCPDDVDDPKYETAEGVQDYCYRAMLAAAPSPSVNEQGDRGKSG